MKVKDLMKKVLGSQHEREIKTLRPLVEEITS